MNVRPDTPWPIGPWFTLFRGRNAPKIMEIRNPLVELGLMLPDSVGEMQPREASDGSVSTSQRQGIHRPDSRHPGGEIQPNSRAQRRQRAALRISLVRFQRRVGHSRRSRICLTATPAPSVRPAPVGEFRLIDAMRVSVFTTLDLQIAKFFFRMGASNHQSRHPIDDIDRQAETVCFVTDG